MRERLHARITQLGVKKACDDFLIARAPGSQLYMRTTLMYTIVLERLWQRNIPVCKYNLQCEERNKEKTPHVSALLHKVDSCMQTKGA